MRAAKEHKPQQSRVIQSTDYNSTLQRAVLTRSMNKIVEETNFDNQEDVYEIYEIFSQKYKEDIVIEMINRILRPNNVLFDGISFKTISEEGQSYGIGMDEEAFDSDEDFNIQDDEFGANISYHGDLNEYDDGTYVDNYINELREGTIQLARKGNTMSGPKNYFGTCGYYKDIAYMTGNNGDIDFNKPSLGKIYATTVIYDSLVNLPCTINKSNRAQHFALADKQYADNKGWGKASDATNYRKGRYTWHHLRTPHQMILVDMTVHAKHGHNGGVYLW